ncbi:hypothetical protein GCM10023065_31970 [Microbacterium laevaniformans]
MTRCADSSTPRHSCSGAVYDGVDAVLMAPPFWVIVVVFAALAFAASGGGSPAEPRSGFC